MFSPSNKMLDAEGKELQWNRGYKYFGASKDLPGVKELFEPDPPKALKKTRAEYMRYVDAHYFGYMDEEDGQDYPEFLLPLWSHETLLVLLPCSLSLQPRPNLTTRIMRLAATISRNLYFSNLGLLGIHLLLFFRVRHVCLRMITMQ